MSSRPIIKPYPVIQDGDLSGNLTSKVSIIDNLSMVSYGLSWVGTAPLGVISVQVSNDYKQDGAGVVQNAGTWNTLPLSGSPSISGNTGNGFIDIDAQAGYALRLVYTRTSGVGLLQVLVTGKVA